jgi:hypothetical protein
LCGRGIGGTFFVGEAKQKSIMQIVATSERTLATTEAILAKAVSLKVPLTGFAAGRGINFKWITGFQWPSVEAVIAITCACFVELTTFMRRAS